MTRKRMNLWAWDNSIQVEDGERTAFYYHITPSSFYRFEKLTWHAKTLELGVLANVGEDGLLFISIDRG